MGQLRSATRALATTGVGPEALLDGLDAYAGTHRVGQMATVVYAQLELATGQLRYACAGHLPPVVQGPDDAPAFLWEGRSTPLDIHVDEASRAEAAYVLPPGGTLILYTDGLVERRSETLEDGMERLLAQLAVTGPAAPGFAAALADELRGPDQDDDVCVLAACVGGARCGDGPAGGTTGVQRTRH
jgi:serine/threonine-protein kinase RsbW